MLLATVPSLFARMAELVTSFGLTLFLQTGLLIGLGLLGSRWLRRRGAAPQATLLRLTLAAVAICPVVALAWHISGFRLQPIQFPSSTTQSAPASAPIEVEVPSSPFPADHDAARTSPINRQPLRSTSALPAGQWGDAPPFLVSDAYEVMPPRDTAAAAAAPSDAQPISPPAHAATEVNEGREASDSQDSGLGSCTWFCIAFAAAWTLTTVILLARLVYGWLRMRRVCREARLAPAPVQAACAKLAEDFGLEAPQVLISPQAPVPCLVGIRNPVILYPAGERATTVEVLSHELAHLARRDCLWFLIGHIAQAILFFQPLLRVLVREFERASDEVCDDMVLECSGNRRRYACELLRIAQIQQQGHGRLLAALGAVAFRSRLGRRVERIVNLGRTLSTRTGRRDRLALTLATVCCTSLITLFQVGTTPAEARDADMPAIRESSVIDGYGLPEASNPPPPVSEASPLQPRASAAADNNHRQPSWDPAVAEAMRTRVNSWLASAASAVRQTATTQTDKPAEREALEPPPEAASASPSSQPSDDEKTTVTPDKNVDTQPGVNDRRESLNNLKRVELQGTVYDNDGRPAADAEVWAYPCADNFWQMIESTADADGRFRLSLTPGEWSVLARKDNRMGGANNVWGSVGIVASNPPEPCAIRLTPGGTLCGQLLDRESGEPIRYGRIWIDDCGLVQADENGRYVVRGLSLDAHHMVVICPGYRRSYVLLDTSLRREAELDLRLTRAGRITGKIVDAQGRPIPNARCGYNVSGNTTAIVALFEGCDEKGQFAWDGAPYDRPTTLEAEAAGYSSEQKEITVTEGADPPYVVFQLKREAPESMRESNRTITGVVRTSDGKTVRGAKVRFHHHFMQKRRLETTTDRAGRFTLRQVPDHIGYLVATAGSHSPTFASVVRPGNLDGDLVLDSGRTVRGIVRDANGDPREGIFVLPVAAASLQAACFEPWVWQLHTVTDHEGRFELRNLPADGFRYDFFDPENNRTSRLDLQDNAVITMAGPGAFRGRVVDPQGNPMRDFRLMLDLTDCVPTRPTFQSPSVNGSDPNAHTTGIYAGLRSLGVLYTSADGTFVLSGVAETNVNMVIAQVPGYGRAVVDCAYARIREKLGPPEELTLQLSPPHHLRVQVVRESAPDQPIAGASVGLLTHHYRDPPQHFDWSDVDRRAMSARTDENGWASFSDLSADEGTVIVQADGFARERVDWRADNADKPNVTIRLKPECVVSAVLRNLSGNGPLRDFRANLERGIYKDYSKDRKGEVSTSGTGFWTPQEYHCIQVGPSENGEFRFSGLPAGRYLLVVRTRDLERPPYQFYREEFILSEGESHEINTVASRPVPLDLWGRPVTAASRNGTFFPKHGAIGFMAGSTNRGQPGGR